MIELLVAVANGLTGVGVILILAMWPGATRIPVPYRLGMWVGATGLVCQAIVFICDGTLSTDPQLVQLWMLTDAGYWILVLSALCQHRALVMQVLRTALQGHHGQSVRKS